MKSSASFGDLFIGIAALCLAATPNPALAQAAETPDKRVRIAAGPQIGPAYPGADRFFVAPFFDIDTANPGEPFAHEASDESTGIPLLNFGGVSIGPIIGFTAKRDAEDTTAGLRQINTTVELGASVTANISPSLYAFVEAGRGIGGHDAWTGQAGIDYVVRAGDEWLFAAGPRATFGDNRHARAYFGVSAPESAATGLNAFDADGGIQSIGGTASTLVALDERWAVSGYARYDRLIGDAAVSPITGAFGKRSQFSAGLALNYTFTWKRD